MPKNVYKPVSLTREVEWETLSQSRHFKPSAIYRMSDPAQTQWWLKNAGMTHSEYFKDTSLGAVITYLRAVVFDVRFMPQDALGVQFTSHMGTFPLRDSLRFGGKDIVELRSGKKKEKAAELTSHWLWFHIPRKGKPGTIREAPMLFGDSAEAFEKDPPAPSFAGERVSTFRWSQRETDMNQHVNSISFIERAENAVADAEATVPECVTVEVWYHRPGFLGQKFAAYYEEEKGAQLVRLVNLDKDEDSATIRFR